MSFQNMNNLSSSDRKYFNMTGTAADQVPRKKYINYYINMTGTGADQVTRKEYIMSNQ